MESQEVWKEIVGFDRYYISNLGNVKSTIGKEKILNQYILPNGYYQVKLRKDNKSYNRLVHRLVAIAFVDTDDIGKDVHHKNKDKRDNKATNLQWLTREEHIRLHSLAPAAHCKIIEEKETIDCGQPTIETIG